MNPDFAPPTTQPCKFRNVREAYYTAKQLPELERRRWPAGASTRPLAAASVTWEELALSGLRVSLLLVTTAVFLGCGFGQPCGGKPCSTAELAEILGKDHRPFEPRFVGFGFAPCHEPAGEQGLVPERRCSEPLTEESSRGRRFKKAYAALWNDPRVRTTLKGNAEVPAPASMLHAAAVAEFLGRGPEHAVEAFEAAVAADPTSAAAQSDLAAAYLVRAARNDRPRDIARALAAAEKALEIDGLLPEARFNRALALEGFFLDHPAGKAWEAYLEVDGESRWAGEARRRKESASAPPLDADRVRADLREAAAANDREALAGLVRRQPGLAREVVELLVFSGWLHAGETGDEPGRTRAMASAQVLAGVIEEEIADPFLTELVDAVASARESQLPSLRAVGRYVEHFAAGGVPDGSVCPALGGAITELGQDHPAGALAEVGSSVCEFYAGNAPGAIDRLNRLAASEWSRRSPSTAARIEWLLGLDQVVLNRLGSAHDHYSKARSLYGGHGDRAGVGRLDRMLSELFFLVGDESQAWRHSLLALSALDELWSDRQRLHLLAAVARSVSPFEPRLARELHTEMLTLGERANYAATVVDAAMYRAMDHERLGAPESARADIALAKASFGSVPATPARARQEADLRLVEAQILLAEDPSAARRALDEALEFYSGANHHFYRVLAFYTRARAALALGDVAAAEKDLAAGIAEMRVGAGSLQDQWLRTLYQDTVHVLFEEMTALLFDQGRSAEEVFLHVESGRAQAFLAELSRLHNGQEGRRDLLRAAVQVATVDEVIAALPANDVILDLSFSRERTFAWRFDRKGVAMFELGVSRSELERQVSKFGELGHDAFSSDVLDALEVDVYSELLGPVLAGVDHATLLLFVPDGPIHSLPLEALRNPVTGTQISRTFPVAYVPSATAFAHSAKAPVEPASEEFFLAAAPELDSVEFPSLPDLPGARAESSAIRQTLPHAVVVEGGRATARAFLDALGKFRVVQFSGHAVFNDEDPMSSYLAFAPDPE